MRPKFTISRNQKIMLLLAMNHPRGKCYYQTLVRHFSCHKSSISRSVHKLEIIGAMTREKHYAVITDFGRELAISRIFKPGHFLHELTLISTYVKEHQAKDIKAHQKPPKRKHYHDSIIDNKDL